MSGHYIARIGVRGLCGLLLVHGCGGSDSPQKMAQALQLGSARPDELPKVFEPFYRAAGTDASGFGLGLAIAQRAVEAHGGTIRAANIPGGGLSVEISLPSFTQR